MKLVTLLLCLFASSNAAESALTNGIGYYENLSAETFLLLGDGFRDAITDERKINYCNAFYEFSFMYWLHTRQGSTTGSPKVDAVIRKVYQGFRNYTPAEHLLNDPLRWTGKKPADRWKVIGFESMDDDVYRQYVEAYGKFVEAK